MKIVVGLFSIFGIGLLVGLVVAQGLDRVTDALLASGWAVLLLCLYGLLPMAANAASWRSILPENDRPPVPSIMLMSWIGGSVNVLLPVAQVGGDFVRARLLVLRGIRRSSAGASVIVDVTIGIVTQILPGVLGILLLIQYDQLGDVSIAAAIGIGILALFIFLFYLAQRWGLFSRLTRFLKRTSKVRDWTAVTSGARTLDNAIAATYNRRHDLMIAIVWRSLGSLVGTGQMMIGLAFLGHPIGLLEALILESMTHAIRNAAFMIPGALGVQEGGYIIIGSILGFGSETALALSLLLRARIFITCLPAILYWQFIENRRLIASIDQSGSPTSKTKNNTT